LLTRLGAIQFFGGLSEAERAAWLVKHADAREYDLHDVAAGATMEVLQLGTGNLATAPKAEDIEEFRTATAPIPTERIFRAIPPTNPDSKAKRHTLFFLPQFWRIDETQQALSLEEIARRGGQLLDVDQGCLAPHPQASSSCVSRPQTSSTAAAAAATVALAVPRVVLPPNLPTLQTDSKSSSSATSGAKASAVSVNGDTSAILGLIVGRQGLASLDKAQVLNAIRTALPDAPGTACSVMFALCCAFSLCCEFSLCCALCVH
jgi:hypothetical protein